MVLAAGVELAKVGQTVGETSGIWEQAEQDNEDGQWAGKSQQDREQESKDRWTIMLITAAGCLAFKNDAVGFLAGLVWHWGLEMPGWIARLRHGNGSIRLRRDGHAEQGAGLFSVHQNET